MIGGGRLVRGALGPWVRRYLVMTEQSEPCELDQPRARCDRPHENAY